MSEGEKPPLIVVDELLRAHLKPENGHVVAAFSFRDLPGTYLFYSAGTNTRSFLLGDEREVFEKIGFYEDLARRYGGTCVSEVLLLERRSEFIERATVAITETTEPNATNNLNYLLGTLGELAKL